jgi:hypothetical protein
VAPNHTLAFVAFSTPNRHKIPHTARKSFTPLCDLATVKEGRTWRLRVYESAAERQGHLRKKGTSVTESGPALRNANGAVLSAVTASIGQTERAEGIRDVSQSRACRRRPVLESQTGLSFDPLLPFEAWRMLGTRIARHASASAWWLGDWLAYGQMKYGRRYKAAIADTGLDYQTLRNYAVVARRFELSRRRDNLTFHHHAEVCALPDAEQDRWLNLASTHGWSKTELRRQLRPARAATAQRRALLRLEVAVERERSWRMAAEQSGCEFDDWVRLVLDEAAGLTLGRSGAPAAGATV